MRAQGEPSPLLRIADTWLRGELAEKEKDGKVREEAQGQQALDEKNPDALNYVRGGGFSAGRMAAYDTIGQA